MLFKRKIERAQNWLHEQSNHRSSGEEHTHDDLPSMEELREEAISQNNLEKGDIPAMLIAAFVTFMPVVILVLLVLCVWVLFL